MGAKTVIFVASAKLFDKLEWSNNLKNILNFFVSSNAWNKGGDREDDELECTDCECGKSNWLMPWMIPWWYLRLRVCGTRIELVILDSMLTKSFSCALGIWDVVNTRNVTWYIRWSLTVLFLSLSPLHISMVDRSMIFMHNKLIKTFSAHWQTEKVSVSVLYYFNKNSIQNNWRGESDHLFRLRLFMESKLQWAVDQNTFQYSLSTGWSDLFKNLNFMSFIQIK